jgi:hypothetical protein
VFEIGTSLREARLRQKIELAEAEQSTKIRGKYLRALEGEQFELLPGQTYVKGFLRSYAEFLGLDGQLYVDEYNSRYVPGDDELVFRPRRSSAGRAQRHVESSVVMFALAGIAALTALVIAAWKFGGDEPQSIPDASRTPAVPAKNAPPKIVLRSVRGESYVIVRKISAAGKEVFRGTLEPGKPKSFTSRRLWFDVQPPVNIRITVNGMPAEIPRGGTAEEFIVTRRGASLVPH